MTASSAPSSSSRTEEGLLPPVVAVVGLSDSGKTTLVVNLVRALRERGLRVGTIKHHPEAIETDLPGKDTWKHRQAGADGTILSTPSSISMVRSADHDHSPAELARFLADMDIVLAEGYKNADVPKIEVHRDGLGRSPLCLEDPRLLALVTEGRVPAGVPGFHPGDTRGLSRFLVRLLGLHP